MATKMINFKTNATLALDLGTTTGWALRTADGQTVSGTQLFKPGRFEGGGMRYLRFRGWLAEVAALASSVPSTSRKCDDMQASTPLTLTAGSWQR